MKVRFKRVRLICNRRGMLLRIIRLWYTKRSRSLPNQLKEEVQRAGLRKLPTSQNSTTTFSTTEGPTKTVAISTISKTKTPRKKISNNIKTTSSVKDQTSHATTKTNRKASTSTIRGSLSTASRGIFPSKIWSRSSTIRWSVIISLDWCRRGCKRLVVRVATLYFSSI